MPLHRPTSLEEPLATRAHELDATLRDATQDLGFVLDLSDPGPAPGHLRDIDMITRAGRAAPGEPGRGTWVVSARLEQLASDSFLLRLVAVPPNGKELRVRAENVKGADVSVRGLVLLRDLLSPAAAAEAESGERERLRVDPSASLGVVAPSRSPGRAILAVNGALFGGYVGYSLELGRAGRMRPARQALPAPRARGVPWGVGLVGAARWRPRSGTSPLATRGTLSAGAWWERGVRPAHLADGVQRPRLAATLRLGNRRRGSRGSRSAPSPSRAPRAAGWTKATFVLTHSGAGIGLRGSAR